jgi:hypothetical protein
MEDLGCFAAVTDGFHASLVHQELMTGLRPVGHTRVFIDVITPNAGGLTPEKWRKDATICPQHWPTDLSLLCGWYRNDTLEAFAAESYTRLQRQHMFADLSVDLTALSQRIFYEHACRYVPIDALKEQMAKKFFLHERTKESCRSTDHVGASCRTDFIATEGSSCPSSEIYIGKQLGDQP